MSMHTYDIVRPQNFEQLHRSIEKARKLGHIGVSLAVVERELSEFDQRRLGGDPDCEELHFVPQLRSYDDDSVVGRVQTQSDDSLTDIGGARVSRRASCDREQRHVGELMLTVFRS